MKIVLTYSGPARVINIRNDSLLALFTTGYENPAIQSMTPVEMFTITSSLA